MSTARRASSWRASPGIDAALALQIARMVASVRKEDLRKVPGVAETLDWAATLVGLDVHDLRDEPEAVHETMMCLLKTHEDQSRVTREVTGTPAGKGRVSCCGTNPGYDDLDEVSRLVSARLAAFLSTLRDNGFTVGLAEGQDAAALLAAGYGDRPGSAALGLQASVLARKSDWEKFDEIFDAFWLGRACVARRCIARATAAGANNPSLKTMPNSPDAGGARRIDRPGRRPADDGERRNAPARAAWKAPRAPRIWPRPISARSPIPTHIAQAHALAARLAQRMRTRLTRRERGAAARLPARSAPHHPPQYQPWRHADRAWSGGSARKSRCGWWCCSMPPAR